jgi:predicted PurR-regulated permease PerM
MIVLAYLIYLMVKPFLTYLALGVALSIAAYPLYLKIVEKTKKRKISAFTSVIMVMLIVVIPAISLISALVAETISFFNNVDLSFVSEIAAQVNEVTGQQTDLTKHVQEFVISAGQYSVNWTLSVLGSASEAVIGLFIMFMIMYYLFLDGPNLIENFGAFVPFNKEQQDHLVQRIKIVSKTVIYGEVMIALAQGFLGGIIFLLLGIPNPVFWGFIIAILAFLPFVGSGMVWIPAAALKIMQGQVWTGVFLMLYGFMIIGGIDYILRPKIIAGRTRIHPLTALLGAFGGLRLFGFLGLILGPLIAAMFETLIKFHLDEKKENETKNNKITSKKTKSKKR